MSPKTTLRLVGGLIILFNLWLAGAYRITGTLLFFMTFGVAIALEWGVIRRMPSQDESKSLGKNDAIAFAIFIAGVFGLSAYMVSSSGIESASTFDECVAKAATMPTERGVSVAKSSCDQVFIQRPAQAERERISSEENAVWNEVRTSPGMTVDKANARLGTNGQPFYKGVRACSNAENQRCIVMAWEKPDGLSAYLAEVSEKEPRVFFSSYEKPIPFVPGLNPLKDPKAL